MIAFVIFVVVLSIIEVYRMKKDQLTRELVVYGVLALITLLYGIIYFNNPYEFSFSKLIAEGFQLK